jgi:hypothetical protein
LNTSCQWHERNWREHRERLDRLEEQDQKRAAPGREAVPGFSSPAYFNCNSPDSAHESPWLSVEMATKKTTSAVEPENAPYTAL